MHKKLLAGIGAVALSVTMAVGTMAPAQAAPAQAQASNARQFATVQPAQITQAITDAAGNVLGTFNGTFTPTGFTQQNGQLAVTGLLNGTVTDAAGVLLQTVTNLQLTTTVTNALNPSGDCDILDLVLGPLHLTLLGLNVDLNQVVLNITATPGPGNLLGNLLCSVAGLLDGNGLNGLVARLNRLLGL